MAVKKMPEKRAVTARFSKEEYLRLQQEAENKGTTITDVVRMSWSAYQEETKIKEYLFLFERRQKIAFFKMLCAVAGLKSAETKEVINKLKEMGVKF